MLFSPNPPMNSGQAYPSPMPKFRRVRVPPAGREGATQFIMVHLTDY